MIFENCDDVLHSDVEQRKRFESALKRNVTIELLDLDARVAKFIGSTGEIYNTTLSSCTCMDYTLRKLPCKHMYRLAVECNLIDPNEDPWRTYKEYSSTVKRLKKKMDKMTWDQLKDLEVYIDKSLGDQT